MKNFLTFLQTHYDNASPLSPSYTLLVDLPVFFSFFSAGGTAVLMNLDRIADFMSSAGSQARVLGVADSGWFLETQQVMSQRTDCSDAFYCNPAQAIQIGTK